MPIAMIGRSVNCWAIAITAEVSITAKVGIRAGEIACDASSAGHGQPFLIGRVKANYSTSTLARIEQWLAW
jgi:hypothetical protein